jgi:hypothetical protein
MLEWLIGDWAEPLGESGGASDGKAGESDGERWHLQDCSPHPCQLKIDGLAPTSKYWMYWSHAKVMRLVILVVYYQQMFGFLHYLYGCGGERNWVGTRRSGNRRAGDVVSNPFSRE